MAAIDPLLKRLVQAGASDLHLAVGLPIKMRVGGELEVLRERPLTDEEAERLLREVCGERRWKRFVDRKDLDFAYGVPGLVRLRASYLQTGRGLAAVFHTVPDRVATCEELGLPPQVVAMADAPRGLVLVTGPTGSGKSTTLAAMIDRINARATRHIILLEDPIEFLHNDQRSMIVQREIGTHAASFARALRAAVREDPDVILVGELRDAETMALALDAAEMGFLVFGTLHTNGAARSMDRIIDMFPPARQPAARLALASCLRGVVSQLLLRTADGQGRVAVHEVLTVTPGVRNLVRAGDSAKLRSAMQSGRSQGMQTLDQALLDLVRRRQIAPTTAVAVAQDREAMAKTLGAAATPRAR